MPNARWPFTVVSKYTAINKTTLPVLNLSGVVMCHLTCPVPFSSFQQFFQTPDFYSSMKIFYLVSSFESENFLKNNQWT
jgi:calcineurin-like phosphoesterase